jgi:hypothetical protein
MGILRPNLFKEQECSAMQKIPNVYPSFGFSGNMINSAESIPSIDARLLKHLSLMYETGLSSSAMPVALGIDENTAKRLIGLLGYASTVRGE